jgi:hypothetical protein
MEDEGAVRMKRPCTCINCSEKGHNKRSCDNNYLDLQLMMNLFNINLTGLSSDYSFNIFLMREREREREV